MFMQWGGDMEVDNDDRVWADNIKAYIENEDDKLPPVGRFNWGQKIYFWAMVGSTILLLLSGFVLWYVAVSYTHLSLGLVYLENQARV